MVQSPVFLPLLPEEKPACRVSFGHKVLLFSYSEKGTIAVCAYRFHGDVLFYDARLHGNNLS
jgi:hypothetical protein